LEIKNDEVNHQAEKGGGQQMNKQGGEK